ncbi:MAG: hypothetical protein D6790_16560, partial [Caldilineae bacterium]
MQREVGGAYAPPVSQTGPSLLSWIYRLVTLAVIDGAAIWLLYQMFRDGIWQLGLAIGIVTILLNVIFLWEELYPLRWISPGLALLIIMVAYPILFSIYTAFTNYGDGHLLSKPLAIQVLEKQRFLPEGAELYDYVAYVSPGGESYALYITAPDGQAFIARPNQPLEPAGPEPPESIDGYRQLSRADLLREG